MAITPTAITNWSGVATYLSNLKDRDGNNYFTAATYSSSKIKLRTEASGTKRIAIINCNDYPNILAYNNNSATSDDSYIGETSQSYDSVDISKTTAFHTRNGCCINFFNSFNEMVWFIGVGKTESGDIFICCGRPSLWRDSEPLSLSHTYTAPQFYNKVEQHSIVTNQTALYAEPVCTPVNKTDKWYKFYFNKCSQLSTGSGAIVLNGKTYYTNTYISILDD